MWPSGDWRPNRPSVRSSRGRAPLSRCGRMLPLVPGSRMPLTSRNWTVLRADEARHPELYAHVARSLVKLSTSGSDGVAAQVGLLMREIDWQPKLSELGISADMIAAVVDKALNDPVTVNTATIPSREDLLSMLQGLL